MLIARWRAIKIKLMMVIRLFAIKKSAQAVLGRDTYLRILKDVQHQNEEDARPQDVPSRIVQGELLGAPLRRGTGAARLHPTQCDHPETSVKARANAKAKWFTCLQCQARWERKSLEPMEITTEHDFLLFGCHKDKTYGEMRQHHPSYCKWVLRTTELETDTCPMLMRFASWLMEVDAACEDNMDPDSMPIYTESEGESPAASTLNSDWARASQP